MRTTRIHTNWALCALLALTLPVTVAACGDDDGEATTPDTPLEVTEPAVETAKKFVLARDSSNVEFLMEAPLENIHGVAEDAMEGELFVELSDLTKSTGLVKVDLMELELFQRKRETADEELGEETKNDTQNEHMRTWLQISDDAPEATREQFRWAQFRIASVENPTNPDVMSMEGAERRVTVTAKGQLQVHGKTVPATAQLELVFAFEGEQVTSLTARTAEPVLVDLAAHEVQPRSAFDVLAEKTLSALGEKVASAAPITFEVTARPVAGSATAGDTLEGAAAE